MKRRIVVGVGGGIAAYKACELVRELSRGGAEVRVAMTRAAQKFIGPLTFQNLTGHPVLTEPLDPGQDTNFGHIELARWAELFVLAPATADLIARAHAGLGDDAVTTSLLAYSGPVLLAPAMNTVMFENHRTRTNLAELAAEPRYRVVDPGEGLLACGEVGKGRLAEVTEIARAAFSLLGGGSLAGKTVLVTAGPTREFLDPVRFLSNPSTGKMGLALARAARDRGARVQVVLGPVATPEREGLAGLEVIPITSADEMAEAVLARVDAADFFIATAAVSDWKPKHRAPQKVKKGNSADENLELVRTPDVLARASERVRSNATRPVLVGFAAETENLVANARDKLERKRCDFIVANDLTQPDAGFGTDTNRVQWISQEGAPLAFAGTKRRVAEWIWERLTSS